MKIVRRIILLIGTLPLLACAHSSWLGHLAQKPVREAVATLKQDGFKTDFAEFHLELSADEAMNFQILTNAGTQAKLPRRFQKIDHATPVKADAGYVSLRDITLYGGDYWTALGEHLQLHKTVLDEACRVLLSAPVKANSVHTNDMSKWMPAFSPELRHLSDTLSRQTLLETHKGNQAAAWTNLLAVTRLGTRQSPAPSDANYLLHFQSLSTAAKTTWEILQTNVWSDNQLAQLQHEWESVEIWKHLPDTVAHRRIAYCDLIRSERTRPSINTSGSLLKALKTTFKSPIDGVKQIYSWSRDSLNAFRYRTYGSYQIELAIIENYRNLERDYQNALTLPDWRSMSHHHAVTNGPYFDISVFETFGYPSSAMMMIMAIQYGAGGQIENGIFEATAEVETIRRLAIVAIALRRFQLQSKKYPDNLQDLVPQFLSAVPLDFMDGQPLRYRRTENDNFVLYSVGQDFVDHHGTAYEIWTDFFPAEPPYYHGCTTMNYDIVWLRPASEAETRSLPNSLTDYQTALAGGKAYHKSPPNLIRRYCLKPATPRYLESGITNQP